MQPFKSFSRRSFIVVVLLNLIFFIGMGFILKLAMTTASKTVAGLNLPPEASEPLSAIFIHVQKVNDLVQLYALPGAVFIGVFLAITAWIILRVSTRPLFDNRLHAIQPAAPSVQVSGEPSAELKKRQRIQDQRLYLQVLSVLQREGRFLDFLAEDLSPYDDSQIGAAVRNIHENCKKVVEKTLKPCAVIEMAEGEEITVEDGFDPSEIKLVGNVVGEPPFKGILRHKGWKVGRIDLPTLSGDQDPTILSPAEVELR